MKNIFKTKPQTFVEKKYVPIVIFYFADILGIWRPVLDLAGGGIMSFPNGSLIIEVVSLSDEGMYSCNVENGVGKPLNKNIWITVNSKY